MYRLFYVSKAAEGMDEASLEKLVEKAAVRNARLGVTGALVFNGTDFGQVLEGQREAIEAVMASIRDDTRHTGIIIVSEGLCSERRWDGWSMTHVEGIGFAPLVESVCGN